MIETSFHTDSVLSPDGTTIGYRQYGKGAGLVLVQGAMGTAQNFAGLAAALAETFTVCVPDRRGRGTSGPYGDAYSVARDVEDLEAVLYRTGSQFVFGLSSGALIALQAAMTPIGIDRLALYEPPLFVDEPLPFELMTRYEREIAAGDVAAALVSGMLASQMGPPIFNRIPRPLLTLLTRLAMRYEARDGKSGYVPMRELAPTLHYEFELIVEMSGVLDRIRRLAAPVLLLGGSQSPAFLKRGLDAIEARLANVTRLELAGVGHGAAWNTDRGGSPERVAKALRDFFA